MPNITRQNSDLDKRITEKEILECIDQLKSGKSAGIDGVINEYLKTSKEILMPLYVKLFNIILDTGIIPSDWSLGVIIPIHKKGDKANPDNYRGITLLSCFGKLFTSVLNNRLYKFLEQNELLSEVQAGFRKGYSTAEQVFNLKCLIDLTLESKKKLYCGFVDFKKAFDTVWRAGLWVKLINTNITGKCYNVIYNLYKQTKSCVAINGQKSEFFNCVIGVRQGENLSPLLFAIFLNDLESFLSQYSGSGGISVLRHDTLNDTLTFLKLFILLYADDTVLLADSAQGLQKALDGLSTYCKLWQLEVNTDKTKVMVISKRKTKVNTIFRYNNQVIEKVDQFQYLGVVFNSRGNFFQAKKHLHTQASKAMHSLLKNIRSNSLPVDLSLQLFDSLVMPILLYCCEVWGYEDFKILEKLHLKFCKLILGVPRSAPSYVVYGELGRQPLSSFIYPRMLKFWGKLVVNANRNKLSKILYYSIIPIINTEKHTNNIPRFKWVKHIQKLLQEIGYPGIWTTHTFPSIEWLYRTARLRLSDRFKQEWDSNKSSSQSKHYFSVKTELKLENYLMKLSDSQRILILKLRASLLRLPVTLGRYDNIPYEQRVCTSCKSGHIGDEFHFILECQTLQELRRKYIPEYFWKYPNIYKLGSLLNSKNILLISKVAKFVKEGLKLIS